MDNAKKEQLLRQAMGRFFPSRPFILVDDLVFVWNEQMRLPVVKVDIQDLMHKVLARWIDALRAGFASGEVVTYFPDAADAAVSVLIPGPLAHDWLALDVAVKLMMVAWDLEHVENPKASAKACIIAGDMDDEGRVVVRLDRNFYDAVIRATSPVIGNLPTPLRHALTVIHNWFQEAGDSANVVRQAPLVSTHPGSLESGTKENLYVMISTDSGLMQDVVLNGAVQHPMNNSQAQEDDDDVLDIGLPGSRMNH